MGNHKTKRLRALEHNRLYAIARGEGAATNQPKRAVKIGSVGLVHDGKTFLSAAIKKDESNPWKIKGTFSEYFCLLLIFFASFEGATWLIQF